MKTCPVSQVIDKKDTVETSMALPIATAPQDNSLSPLACMHEDWGHGMKLHTPHSWRDRQLPCLEPGKEAPFLLLYTLNQYDCIPQTLEQDFTPKTHLVLRNSSQVSKVFSLWRKCPPFSRLWWFFSTSSSSLPPPFPLPLLPSPPSSFSSSYIFLLNYKYYLWLRTFWKVWTQNASSVPLF